MKQSPRNPNLNGYYINFSLLAKKLKEIAYEKGMTQSELAAGITPRDHLNKILNGKRNPSLELLYQLCNKLHVDIRLLIEQCYYLNYTETSDYIHQMKRCTTTGNYNRLEELIQICSGLPDFQDGIGKQFLTYQKGVLVLKKYKNVVEALSLFNDALNTFSIRDVDGNEITRIFTIEEIGIQVDKAACLYNMGLKEEAFDLIQTSINSHLTTYETVETYHILRAYFYLSQFYLQDNNFEKCIEVSTEGIMLSNCKFVYIYAGDLNATKGTALFRLGRQQDAAYHFRRAFEFYTIHGHARLAKSLEQHLKKIDFDTHLINFDVTHPVN